MGYWFGEFSNCTSWRKTPVKIGNTWYTPSGERIRNPKAYFAKVRRNGRYWENNTGWKKSNKFCEREYDDFDYNFENYDNEDYDYNDNSYEEERWDLRDIYGDFYDDEFDDYE